MQPAKAKKIEVNPAQTGLAGLGGAFAGLNLGPLPEGPAAPALPAIRKTKKLGRVVLRKETAHRGGKAVIVVHDFPPHFVAGEIEELAKHLRKALGTGGTVRERTIEMQGEQAGKIRSVLESQGWQVAGV